MQHTVLLTVGASRYVLHTKSRLSARSSQHLTFTCEVQARQFLSGAGVSGVAINRFAAHIQGFERWHCAHPYASCENFLAWAIVRGEVAVYRAIDTSAQKVVARTQSGTRYRLVNACDVPAVKLTRLSLAGAEAKLAQLGLSDNDCAIVARDCGLSAHKHVLAQALADGVLVIREEHPLYTVQADSSEPAPLKAADKPIASNPPPSSNHTAASSAHSSSASHRPPKDHVAQAKAQSQALQAAAEEGAPFCEECEARASSSAA